MKQLPSAIILDVDGVLLDSNGLKEENIRKAASAYADEQLLHEFVSYFTGLNGVPRERKIEKYFGTGSAVSSQILAAYNALNEASLQSVPLTQGAEAFVQHFSKKLPLYAVSGGAEEEVEGALKSAGIAHFFTAIYGGPKSKTENILKFYSEKDTYLFFGDSMHDHLVSTKFNIPFVFLYNYTQFADWKSYFRTFPNVGIYDNIEHWLKSYQVSKKQL